MMPVFIGGCGRSGTTLLGSLVGAHHRCVCVPESQFKSDLLSQPNDLVDREKRASFLRASWRFKTWGLPDEAVAGVSGSQSNSALVLDLVKEYGRIKLGKLGNVWIDHTPNNFDYALLLAQHYPSSKFIHIVRDGRAVAASVLPLPWGPNTVQDAATWWVHRLAVGLAAEQYFGVHGRIMRVDYESLVRNPGPVIDAIWAFLGLEPQAGPAQAAAQIRLPQFTQEQHRLVLESPDVRRIDAWKTVLSQRQVELFEAVAGVLLEFLGYQRQCRGHVPPESDVEAIMARLHKLVKTLLMDRVALRKRLSYREEAE